MTNLVMGTKVIYFDNAATSGRKPETVSHSICDCLEHANANPGRSGHTLSVKAAEIIYSCREILGELFNFPKTENIVLTKNATEALNLALYGGLKNGGEVITTSMEHNSVLRPLNHLHNKGIIRLQIVKADRNGVVHPGQIKESITKETSLIVVTSASNVTGTKMDLQGIYQAAQEAGVKMLVDGAQGAGATRIDLQETPFDFFAITGHKHLFGPQGTGALIIKNTDDLDSFMRGGTGSQSEMTIHPDFPPDKYEAGTLNTPGYAGLVAGIRFILDKGMEKIIAYEHDLTEYLLGKLADIEEIQIYAPDADRVATISFNVQGVPPSDVAYFLDREWGICARSGLHCAPEAHKTLGTFPGGTIRFSLSFFNTKKEIDIAIEALKNFVKHR